MSQFTSPLVTESLDRGWCRRTASWLWRPEPRMLNELTEDFVFEIGHEGSGREIIVPAGFTTDFASIPRAVQWLLPPDGRWKKASVVHDYCYAIESGIGKVLADAIMFEAMKASEVPWHRRWIIFASLLLFGRFGYNQR